jgi:hypothetical protein
MRSYILPKHHVFFSTQRDLKTIFWVGWGGSVERSLYEGNPISLVFQNIDPPSPSPPGESVLPPQQRRGRGTHSPGGEGDVGSIFWKKREVGLPSYNDLSTGGSVTWTN